MVLSGCDSIAVYFGCTLCYILKKEIKSSREMWFSWWADAYAKADKLETVLLVSLQAIINVYNCYFVRM